MQYGVRRLQRLGLRQKRGRETYSMYLVECRPSAFGVLEQAMYLYPRSRSVVVDLKSKCEVSNTKLEELTVVRGFRHPHIYI